MGMENGFVSWNTHRGRGEGEWYHWARMQYPESRHSWAHLHTPGSDQRVTAALGPDRGSWGLAESGI